MTKKVKFEVAKILKDIRFNVCVLERDYGIEWTGYLGRVINFVTECIADKYGIEIGLDKE